MTNRRVKGKLFVVCNGTQTETNYLKELAGLRGKNAKFLVNIKPLKGDPWNILIKLLENKVELNKYDPTIDEIWCVFDIDNFFVNNPTKALATTNRAVKANINLVWSNPCFEVWLLMHFKCLSSELTTAECLKSFEREFLKQFKRRYLKNDPKLFLFLQDKVGEAIRNSAKLDAQEDIVRLMQKNPSTNMGSLVSKILATTEDYE